MQPARAAGSACPHRETSSSEPTLCASFDPPARIASELRGDGRGVLEVLMRRAVVATGKRRALARLALPGRRMTAGDPAVEEARLDLLLDERRRGADAFAHRPGHLRLGPDGEVPTNVREERTVGPCEVVRIVREPGHRALALLEHRPPVIELLLAGGVRVDQVLDGAVDRSRVLIHTRAKLGNVIVQGTYSISPNS